MKQDLTKNFFARTELEYQRNWITQNGVKLLSKKVEAITNTPSASGCQLYSAPIIHGPKEEESIIEKFRTDLPNTPFLWKYTAMLCRLKSRTLFWSISFEVILKSRVESIISSLMVSWDD
jgi:hypothetical protein